MALPLKWKHSPKEQDEEPRYKLTNSQSSDFQQKCQNTKGKVQSLQYNVLGKLHIHIQKTEISPISHMIYKIQLKMG